LYFASLEAIAGKDKGSPQPSQSLIDNPRSVKPLFGSRLVLSIYPAVNFLLKLLCSGSSKNKLSGDVDGFIGGCGWFYRGMWMVLSTVFSKLNPLSCKDYSIFDLEFWRLTSNSKLTLFRKKQLVSTP
jgi:hypothetical protein